MTINSIYLIGSLRNQTIPEVESKIRDHDYDVFAEWIGAGPEADDFFKQYQKGRGLTYSDALKSYAAKHIFEFDKYHLDRCDAAVLVMPAGKSAFLELGYMVGTGKKTYILLEENDDRWDLMFQFCTAVCHNIDELIEELNKSDG